MGYLLVELKTEMSPHQHVVGRRTRFCVRMMMTLRRRIELVVRVPVDIKRRKLRRRFWRRLRLSKMGRMSLVAHA
ncbi:hypothetical protein KSS87_017658 [Heliosperma pusillum]|nr:hypothetical protein KSS87_017658 [Heliosperma pusillum]